MLSFRFQASKIWAFFWKIYCRASFEIMFSGRNNSIEPPVFEFFNSLPYGAEH